MANFEAGVTNTWKTMIALISCGMLFYVHVFFKTIRSFELYSLTIFSPYDENLKQICEVTC